MHAKAIAISAMIGLLAGCPTVDLGDDLAEPGLCRPDPGYFESTIWPEYIAAPADPTRSCVNAAGCHRQSDGRSSLRLDYDPAQPDAVDFSGSYNVVIRFLNCGSPETSSFLTKPLRGIDAHGGGDFIDSDNPNDRQFTSFIAWFDQ